ncbi:CBM20 domain-containing protein [Actinoplanes sp. NEAU-A12]|uniref:alpha-amylase n=1 Tax=Actinoplanes sandaracinus TaxID=3045177 RepID=A0ABT6WC69_9ACTN|nr:CBM20 domain-containing protein [Actinoplanes sandaracinus]MDI6097347.1 CBM20 domain-containing protein [Actinoplanes sandaracinus]
MRNAVRAGVVATTLIAGALGVAGPALAATPVSTEVAVSDVSTLRVAPVVATFNVTAGFTAWGQRVYVVGSIPALGSWNPAAAVPLNTTSGTFPNWTGSVELPPNTYVEFQYIVKNADGTVAQWEKTFANRSAVTPPTGTYITHDTFGAY